jgi:hypothetical protein
MSNHNSSQKNIPAVLRFIAKFLSLFQRDTRDFWQVTYLWSSEDLRSFFEKQYPHLARYIKSAYAVLDGATTETISDAYIAWQKITDVLALQTISFSKNGNKVIVEITTYTSKDPYGENPLYERRIAKRELSSIEMRSLPDYILGDLNHGIDHKIDMVERRNEEFERLGYINNG